MLARLASRDYTGDQLLAFDWSTVVLGPFYIQVTATIQHAAGRTTLPLRCWFPAAQNDLPWLVERWQSGACDPRSYWWTARRRGDYAG